MKVNPFQPATIQGNRLRLALIGPTGSGKTYTALVIASRLAELDGTKVAVIDTEHRTSTKYADRFTFDHLPLDTFSPDQYVTALAAAAEFDYGVIVVDSLSHAWTGTDGALEQVDRAKARHHNSSFSAWRDVTPMHNRLVDALVASPAHLIVTMRAKQHYAVTDGEDANGRRKTVIERLGLAPVQREGVEYEFDVIADIDVDHRAVISKTRCAALDGAVLLKPGAELADTLHGWLAGGAAPSPRLTDDERTAFLNDLAQLPQEVTDALKRQWPPGVPPVTRREFTTAHADRVRDVVKTLQEVPA